MTAAVAVFKRELRSYFGTPVAYVFLVVFLFLSSYLAFRDYLFEARDASLRVFFQYLPGLFALMAPAIAMRMWAEERRTGTVELLFTLPITVGQAVVGKFAAAWVFFAIALVLTAPMVGTVAYLGDPDNGPIVSGYLGAVLMAGSYLAIGGFFSAITKNQVIAFVLGAMFCVLCVYAGSPAILSFAGTVVDVFDTITFGLLTALSVPQAVDSFLESMSFSTHYDVMQRGLIEFRDVFFMLAVTAGFLISTVVVLYDRKAG